MSVKNVLPEADIIRSNILASNKISEKDLQVKVDKMMKNRTLKKNLSLLYSIISEKLEIPVDVTTGVFKASEDVMDADKYITLKEIQTTELSVINLRGYYFGTIKEGIGKNDFAWAVNKFIDDSGSTIIMSGGDKTALFVGEDSIDIGTGLFLSNLQLDEYTDKKGVTRPSVQINDHVSVKEIKAGENGLPVLADVVVDSILDLENVEYPIIKGFISKIEHREIIVCDQAGHKLPIKEAGVPIHCEKCNEELVTSELGVEYVFIIGDDTGEIPVKFWANSNIDPEDFPVGHGMIVSVDYKEKFKNCTGYTAIPYDPFEEAIVKELTIRDTKGEEKTIQVAKKVEKKATDFSELVFHCDEGAGEPTEIQLDALFNAYATTYSNYGLLTPAQLQDFFAGKYDGIKFEMENLVKLIAEKYPTKFRIEDHKFEIEK